MSNLPVEVIKKVENDFLNTLAFWDAARKIENCIYKKDDWNDYFLIRKLQCECAFCEYFLSSYECTNCPLRELHCFYTYAKNLTYWKWHVAKTIEEKCTHAETMYQACKAWIDQNILKEG